MEYNPTWQKIRIECEIESINHYAQEIGLFKNLLEKQDDDRYRQWYNYFINIYEAEIENARETAAKLRAELTAYEMQHSDC